MRQQTQLKLGIISGNDLISLFGDESAPNPPAHLAANRNVLQVWIARRQTPCRRDRLIELTVNASISRDLMRQRVSVHTLQLVELAILDDQTRQLKLLGQLFEHRLAR